MQKKGYFGQFWYMLGPIIIQNIVALAVSMAASTAVLLLNFDEYMKVIMSADQQAIMEYVMEQTNEVLAHSAHLALVTALCTIPIMWILFHRDEKKRKQTTAVGQMSSQKVKWTKFLIIIPFAAAVGLVLNNISLLADLAIASEAYAETSVKQYAIPLIGQLIGYGLITPLSEELIFRGLIYKRLRDDFSFKNAMFTSAILFGFFHGNLIQMLYAFGMGLLLAYLYEKYHSLAAPVLAHGMVNIVSVILTEAGGFTWMFENPLRISLVSILCAAAASGIYVKFFMNDQKDEKISEEK